MGAETATTDAMNAGFTKAAVDPLRYDGQVDDPKESTGLIIRMIPKGSRVLDVGCGTGSVSSLVRDHCGAELVGVEPNPIRAKRAAERGIDVRVGILDEALAGTLGVFDVVLFADVLEHLTEPAALLNLSRRLLRPGGAVVASTPNVAHWTVRLNLLRGRFDYTTLGIMDATHVRWFTAATIRSLFETAGFTVERQTVSAGLWMHEYATKRPWRWLNPETRQNVICAAAGRWPRLFGCQHVIRAIKSD
jgi:methionine biosynthesis protein MetW